MKIIPAVDIMGGKCVRLLRGDPKKNKIYYDDPLEAAQLLENQGAELIHIIDLDAALGYGQNIDVIQRMLESLTAKVQIGGGIRDLKKADQLLNLGSYRVIFGTVAIKNPDLVKEAAKRYGSERIAVAIDEKNGKVAFHGWKNDSNINYLDLARSFGNLDIGCLIFTPISVDGTLKGPQIEKTAELVKSVAVPVIASGGVSKLQDLVELSKIGVDGVIVGTAIYEKKFTMQEAMEILENVS